VFDHPLDASERIAGAAGVSWHHPVSVRPTVTPILSPIAQHEEGRLAILCCSAFPKGLETR
jgi:hypothetical protein